MENQSWDGLDNWHDLNYDRRITERRVTQVECEPLLSELDVSQFKVSDAGRSYESRRIQRVVMGRGDARVLIWTQMHGNESTGTKAVFDLFKWLSDRGSPNAMRDMILEKCTIVVLPVLNPDGAHRYTRLNAQGIDLNRDVIDKNAPETVLLLSELNQITPHYCFNLHDQRSIFSVGSPPKVATMSFLAPSEDQERTVTGSRIRTMRVISAMIEPLKSKIPGQIGRYTDEFYPTATGDNFQRMGYSTILVESGHYPGDYKRKVSRKMTFLSLVAGLHHIAVGEETDHRPYLEIPNNEKLYLDAIVKGVSVGGEKGDLGIFLKEELDGEKLIFRPTLDKFEDLSGFSADRILERADLEFSTIEAAEKWVQIEFN
jgi:hypothetical protein